MENEKRELARANNIDLSLARGFIPSISGHFDGEGWGQGVPSYRIDDVFIVKFMGVFDVENLRDVNGKPCWVTHTHSKILRLEPVLPSEGTPFTFERWSI